MALAGERRIVEIVVVGDGEDLCTPCGGCRQRIREFADAATRVHVAGLAGVRASFALEDLLPHSFGPGTLGAVSAKGRGRGSARLREGLLRAQFAAAAVKRRLTLYEISII